MVLPDLSHYEGTFNAGVFHGNGVLNIVASPSFFIGEWKNGFIEGKGWLLYEPGDWYEGDWHNNLKHGFGERHYKNGCKYKGHWCRGQLDGYGVMVWANQDVSINFVTLFLIRETRQKTYGFGKILFVQNAYR